MSSCMYCQEDMCTLEGRCKHQSFKDGDSLAIIPRCTAKESDLVDLCIDCEMSPACADPPYEDLCMECAKQRRKEDDEFEKECNELGVEEK